MKKLFKLVLKYPIHSTYTDRYPDTLCTFKQILYQNSKYETQLIDILFNSLISMTPEKINKREHNRFLKEKYEIKALIPSLAWCVLKHTTKIKRVADEKGYFEGETTPPVLYDGRYGGSYWEVTRRLKIISPVTDPVIIEQNKQTFNLLEKL